MQSKFQGKLPGPIALIGCGKMGGALLKGWLEKGIPSDQLQIVEPQAKSGQFGPDLHVFANAQQISEKTALIVIAVKPQLLEEILPTYQIFADRSLFLTIAAGKERAFYRNILGQNARIVRAMPNTPAAIGRGMSVLLESKDIDPASLSFCGELMSAVGDIAWVREEEQMHAVTALSGGGPAYVFLLIETLAKAGEKVGLPSDLSMVLARKTVEGAGELSRLSSETAAEMRQAVTSPKGTTLEALNVLMDERTGIQNLFDQAIKSAADRSRELAS